MEDEMPVKYKLKIPEMALQWSTTRLIDIVSVNNMEEEKKLRVDETL